jgi:hypothetical protein
MPVSFTFRPLRNSTSKKIHSRRKGSLSDVPAKISEVTVTAMMAVGRIYHTASSEQNFHLSAYASPNKLPCSDLTTQHVDVHGLSSISGPGCERPQEAGQGNTYVDSSALGTLTGTNTARDYSEPFP